MSYDGKLDRFCIAKLTQERVGLEGERFSPRALFWSEARSLQAEAGGLFGEDLPQGEGWHPSMMTVYTQEAAGKKSAQPNVGGVVLPADTHLHHHFVRRRDTGDYLHHAAATTKNPDGYFWAPPRKDGPSRKAQFTEIGAASAMMTCGIEESLLEQHIAVSDAWIEKNLALLEANMVAQERGTSSPPIPATIQADTAIARRALSDVKLQAQGPNVTH